MTARKLTCLLAAAALASCTQHPTPNTQHPAADTLTVAATTRHLADSTGSYTLSIAFPAGRTATSPLADAIREWASENLGGTYADTLTGNYTELLADTAALANHYFERIVKTNAYEFHELQLYNPEAKRLAISFLDSTVVSKTAEGKNWVTFQNVRDSYTGGAHGSHIVNGQTFRKSDGRRIGWDILLGTYDEEFQALLKAGLIEYWGLRSEAQLEDRLMGDANIYYIPLPQCPPLFSADGISFVYNQYEIAAYAAGLPTFTVPYSKLQPFLNATAHQLLRTN